MFPRVIERHVKATAKRFPILTITGPRQSGKTTLCRMLFPRKPYVSLEAPDVRARVIEDPRGFLADHPDGAVLDEVQRAPELLSYLQALVDAQQRMGQWVLTGSQQLGLLSGITQSLAGRVGLLQLLPFSVGELQAQALWPDDYSLEEMLWRGLYPAPFVRKIQPATWYADYFSTYVERDVRALLQVRDLSAFGLFVRMCAARTGQLLNLSALAADCGVSTNTARGWLSVLEASYIAFTLAPHHVNFGKQLTKSPKLYFHDTGLAAWLVGLRSTQDVLLSPMRGALFENWAVCEALKYSHNHRLDIGLNFWRNKSGLEVDLLLTHGGQLHAVEFKAGQTVASDWFGSLKKYHALHDANTNNQPRNTASPPPTQSVIYGGAAAHTRHAAQVRGWRDWPQYLAQLCPVTELEPAQT